MEQTRILRIVVASPGDVMAEREALPAVLEELNHGIAADRNLRLELIRWETDAYPGFHPEGPQGLIDNVLQIADCDILIGIFWKRFGSPTMGVSSGTEHEIRTAYEACRQNGRPHIMVYFNKKPYTPSSKEETDQWGHVLEFQRQFPKEVMWWNYNGKTQFEKLARQHLTKVIRRLAPSSNTLGVAPEGPAGSLSRVTGALKSLGGLTGKLRAIPVPAATFAPTATVPQPSISLTLAWSRKKLYLVAAVVLLLIVVAVSGYYMLTPNHPEIAKSEFEAPFSDLTLWSLPPNTKGWNPKDDGKTLNMKSEMGLGHTHNTWFGDFNEEFSVTLSNSVSVTWAVRVQHGQSYYLFHLSRLNENESNLSFSILKKNEAPSQLMTRSVNVSLRAGDNYNIKTVAEGSQFTIKLMDEDGTSTRDGAKDFAFSDPQGKYMQGGVGFRTLNAGEEFTIYGFNVKPQATTR